MIVDSPVFDVLGFDITRYDNLEIGDVQVKYL
jgi:hypothetical protein